MRLAFIYHFLSLIYFLFHSLFSSTFVYFLISFIIQFLHSSSCISLFPLLFLFLLYHREFLFFVCCYISSRIIGYSHSSTILFPRNSSFLNHHFFIYYRGFSYSFHHSIYSHLFSLFLHPISSPILYYLLLSCMPFHPYHSHSYRDFSCFLFL